MREMVHKVKPDQVYFSMCKVEFLLCSTYKCFCPKLHSLDFQQNFSTKTL